ncbi:seminal metalloprotease 1-like [Lucilia sericata]|uniref:seminal metalloprotease 1-like n=1 Tax=Lucilia sericata TaxID=13632 RepID=UPI0018A86486|nr:seminal metalloprotease 1-like [Lucilia sericata]
MKKCIILIVWGLLLAHCQAVPVETERVEDDPELKAGLFEGDMDLGNSRNGLLDTTKRWPNGIVRYRIDPVFDIEHSLHILKGMQIIESKSCIRFRHAIDTTKAFIRIKGEPTGCSAKVGYSGTEQNVNLEVYDLDKGCFRIGSIMHELLHALGFYHQHSSTERDNYVKVMWDNIKTGMESNFVKYDSNTVSNFGVEYDYGSVMHYSSTSFSKNGEKTLVALKSTDAVMGQRLELSDSDVLKLNKMYNC